MMAVESGIA